MHNKSAHLNFIIEQRVVSSFNLTKLMTFMLLRYLNIHFIVQWRNCNGAGQIEKANPKPISAHIQLSNPTNSCFLAIFHCHILGLAL